MRQSTKLMAIILAIISITHQCYGQNKWEKVNNPPDAFSFSLFVSSSDVLLAGTGGGIYRSTNNGESWVISTCSNGWAHSIFDFAEDRNSILYASCASGVFRSTDNGMSWSMIKDDYMVSQVVIDENDNLYITASSHEQNYHINKSTDGGESWIDITPDVNEISLFALCYINPDLLVLSTGKEALYSTDKGITWENGEEIDDGFYFNSIASINDKIIGNSINDNISIGIYESADGRQWHMMSTIPEIISIRWLKTDKYRNTLYALDHNLGIIKSSDNGYNWSVFHEGIPDDITVLDIAFSRQGNLFASTDDMSIYMTSAGTAVNERKTPDLGPEIKIYPCPVSGNGFIIDGLDPEIIVNIEMFDICGQKVSGFGYYISGNKVMASIIDILPGLYYLKTTVRGIAYYNTVVVMN